MARRWNDLSPRTRRVIVVGAVVETAIKVAVLVDLRRRDPAGVRGSKKAWAAAMALNSAGVLPVAYLVYGRRSLN